MSAFVDDLNGIIWSSALIYLCLGVGLYFSIRTRFMQLRGIRVMLRLMFRNQSSDSGISSFQALSVSLSGRVGTGNIAGVATAIHFGGPGAVFWMWFVAFLGAATAYIESTLGQIYKEKDHLGRYRGGPAFYIEKAMGQKWYAMTFAIATVVAAGLLLPGVQANSIALSAQQAWGVPPLATAAVTVLVLGAIIFGGITRIARFAELVVPLMAIGYVSMSIIVIALNIERVPEVFTLILSSAFGANAGFGAMLGLAVQWGVKRGVYSNEAGQGTGPHAAAAAEVAHPAEQGYVQAFSVYIDTLFVCSATAFMLLLTQNYNVVDAAGAPLVQHLPGIEPGPGYTQAAVESVASGLGASFVAISLAFFAFTTIVAYYYMAETNINFINRHRPRDWMMLVLKLGAMATVALGCIRTSTTAWALGDLGVGIMAWLNIIAILILQKPALLAFKDYEAQLKQGIQPTFDPIKLGLRGAGHWTQRPPVGTKATLTELDSADLISTSAESSAE